MVTLMPRVSNNAAREAAAIPLPREDTTPPVTKTNLVMGGYINVIDISKQCRHRRTGKE